MDLCLNCMRMHLGRANSLLEEWINGYEGYDWLAMAEMGLAEWHCGVTYPQLRMHIRAERKAFESDRAVLPDLLALVLQINLMEKEHAENTGHVDGDVKAALRAD